MEMFPTICGVFAGNFTKSSPDGVERVRLRNQSNSAYLPAAATSTIVAEWTASEQSTKRGASYERTVTTPSVRLYI
jgi:hypothetical protein